MEESFLPGSARPLPLQMRPGLVVKEQRYAGRTCWAVKDPLQARYYRFEPEEFFLLKRLDGVASLEELRAAFEREFAPQSLAPDELHRLLAMFHRHNLVVSRHAGQGATLLQRYREQAWRQIASRWSNPLYLRFPLGDPDAVLQRLLPWARLGYARPVLVLQALLVLAALLLVGVEFDEFCRRLPALHEFFAARNWIWLAAALGLTKVLHELGHGLACKYFGGECHEMGVLCLVFTPCLYCDVSDAWMLTNKWHRAAIGAAGMQVELVLAAAATFGWWYSAEGLVHYLCLAVMSVCSVSTLMVNANPLMRFDGYYILSDLGEVPNLRAQAADSLKRVWRRGWGMAASDAEACPPGPRWLPVYALAAGVYGLFVGVSIFGFLYRFLEPYTGRVLSQLLLAAIAARVIAGPLRGVGSFSRSTLEHLPRRRTLCMIGAMLLTAVCLGVPLPHRIACELRVEPAAATNVFVRRPGRLQIIHVKEGQSVVAGQVLAELEDLDSELQLERLRGERDRCAIRLQRLRHAALAEDAARTQMAEAAEALAALDERLQRWSAELDGLQIRAPMAGVICPPPQRPGPDLVPGRLERWSGDPLDGRNRGAWLEQGTWLCRIVPDGPLVAMLELPEEQVGFVQAGQTVDCVLDQAPGRRLRSRITQVSRAEVQEPEPDGLRPVAWRMPPPHHRPVFAASVPLEKSSAARVSGGRGRARIHAGYRSLARQGWDWLCQNWGR